MNTFRNIPISDLEEIKENLKGINDEFRRSSILILGGSGFLGTLLKTYFLYLNHTEFRLPFNDINDKYVPHTEDDHCSVITVDNFIGRDKDQEIRDPCLIELKVDINKEDIPDLWTYDFIILAAGCASPSFYREYPLETLDVSYTGTQNILEFAKKQKNCKVITFSSSEVLGTAEIIPTPESSPINVLTDNSRSPYDTGKVVIESLSWVYKTKYNVDVKCVRLFNCIGYFRKDDKRVMPNFISSLIDGDDMKVFLPSTQTRTFSFYTDVITGILQVLTRGKELIYHIGCSEDEVTIAELAQRIEEVTQLKGRTQIVQGPEVYNTEPQRRCPDITKANKEFGFTPKVKLNEMIKRIYEWAKQNY